MGPVAAFSWSDGKSARIRYNTKDRVEEMEIRRGDRIYRHQYEYDARGLRTDARYSPGENPSLSISIDYDEVGNAIQLNRPTPDGGMISDRYVIGAQNQILSASAGRVRPEMAFEYDPAGRLTRSTAGNREAEFVYDELGRLAEVYLDDRHMVTSDYDPMDLDPVLDADDRTDFTPISVPVSSSIYGSQESIAHTRPIGSPFGAVRFVPGMARFVVRDPVVPGPDSVLFSSLQHRILTAVGGIDPKPITGFDKASNSLFIAPELFTANCFVCWDWVSGFGLSRVGSGTITPGQQVTFQADGSASECWTWYYDEDLDYGEVHLPGRFVHYVDYDDGNASTLGGPWGYYNHEDLLFTHSYSSPGVYTVVDDVQCGCNASIFLAQASEGVCVQSPFTPPPSASAPGFTHVSLINSGASWGRISILYDDTSLICSAICDGKFRLEGHITVTSSSYIRISTQMPSRGTCSASSRTLGNISHTETHELVHANAMVSVINDHKAQIGTEYSSQSSCESALDTLTTSLAVDFANEFALQANHVDHAGERRHAAVCPTAGGSTTEIVCGLGGWNCQPHGNCYPGP